MVFNSLTFVIFFAIVLGLHHLPIAWTLKKVNLLLASYLFYAAWDPRFVILLIFAAVVDFNLARWIDRLSSDSARRAILTLSVVLNLGMLGVFKYGNFILETYRDAMAALGIHYSPKPYDIVLPLGISFYTFETISYLVDVYRRKTKPWGSFLDYALFLTFFPHLVAGPIVRANDFLPQCITPRQASSRQLSWGLVLMLLGLFEKIALADQIFAPVADSVYNEAAKATFLDAWLGTLAFAGQIFCDFAGYSTCGIGAALCLGFVLKDNFHFPYAAIGFSDFWKRWHISLSTWLRDYLYISLGGNRRGEGRTYVNLMLTMLLGGLWHGAAWRFVAWGGLHGLYLIGERLLRGWTDRVAILHHAALRPFWALGTFLLVCLTWVFFRAQSFTEAFGLLTKMASPQGLSSGVGALRTGPVMLAALLPLLLVHWKLRDSSVEELFDRLGWPLRMLVLAGMMLAVLFASGTERAFIYFEF